MAYEALQAVVGAAVVDATFRKSLLNGSRGRVIANFGLTREETELVMGIQADTLEQFAGQLDRWIEYVQGRSEPPPLKRAACRQTGSHSESKRPD